MNRLLAGVLVAGVLVAGAEVADARQNKDFSLTNATGFSIARLHLSLTKSNSWGANVLGRDELRDGTSARLRFARAENQCKWDMKLVDAQDKNYVVSGVDFCKVSQITAKYSASTKNIVLEYR